MFLQLDYELRRRFKNLRVFWVYKLAKILNIFFQI